MVGTTISHYKVLEKIGQGGMGEVYRATDTKLNRDVALKILPEQFASDSQRMGRFQREAEVLASLDHPNIGQIYGIEDAGQTKALVLQLIEGPTLAERITQGPIPVEEALKIALQMAEGLEAAHEKGVIHRDLKPANIKVTPEGQVKILDFGLAKALEAEIPDSSLSQSPTLTNAATQAGVILGTAAYMSPEQARGKPTDRRADIWAIGVVLFEMLSGKRAFEGEDISMVLAHVLSQEPNWEKLPADLSPRLGDLLERCLRKDPTLRVQAIGDVRITSQEYLADPVDPLAQPVADAVQAQPRQILPWVLVTFVLTAVTAGVAVWNLRPTESQPLTARFYHKLPDDQAFSRAGRSLLTVSPDGSQIVYVANGQLYLRNLDEMEGRPIQGTDEDPFNPFFSPDGEWVGYFTVLDGELKKIAPIGGAPVTLCDARAPYGASWGLDGTILYGQTQGIMRVSANGGTPELVVPTEESERADGPQMLPGGEWVLFTLASETATTPWDEAQIVVQSLESGERKILWEGGSDARYVPTGHLVYALEDVLFALPFDLASLEVSGGPVPVVEGVRRAYLSNTASANYGFSDRGTLIYVVGAGTGGEPRSLMAVDALGNAAPLTDELRDYFRLRLSPDGRRVAAEVTAAGGSHIWIVDIETGRGSQLTFESSMNQYPTWAADGQTVVFWRDGALYKKASDGSGEEELVYQSETRSPVPTDVSPDGVLAFYESRGGAGGRDIWTLQLEDGSASEFLATPASESMAMFSADGQWLAYVSNQSGQDEVYVRPYPQGSQRLISDGGGTAPIWSRNGQKLYYRSLSGNLMAVPIQTSPSFVPGRLRELFPLARFRTSANAASFDVDVSGEKFIMVSRLDTPETASFQQINVVLNWFEELKERVPVP